jgi:serine/threonine-protein kinase
VPDPRIGSELAGHRIERVLGRGGMGVVYEAVDLSLERTVALKLIAPELAESPGFRRRFIAESRIAASLDHPNVVPIFRAGEEDGALFLAMRFVAGDNLGTIITRKGALAPRRAAGLLAQVTSALEAAHHRGLVHRDVKPANVLVTPEDHCYLTDFGLVEDLGATTGATRSAEVLGTLDYLAPERIRGGATGPWTDVYALGCVLFFALTGRVPFPLEAPESKLWAHVSEPPPRASDAGAPEAFDAVIATALAKEPRDRHESAAAFAAAMLAAAGADTRGAAADSARGLAAEARGTLRGSDAEALLDRLARVADRVKALHDAVADDPPERILHRIAEVRAGHEPAKAERVDALAQRLAAQRRAQAQLETLSAQLDRALAELDTACRRARAGSEPDLAPLATALDQLEPAASA